MVTFRELVMAFRQLGIDGSRPVIVHASLSAFGEVSGGAQTLLGALMSVYRGILAPTFTYKTMVTPEAGPENNGLLYGSSRDQNLMAEFFRPEMPADRLMGALPEALRQHPLARRSLHPILSFAGINLEEAIRCQTMDEPLAPIGWLARAGGVVLLLGVDQTVNTSIHYAERLAGRKQFVRWALTRRGVKECPAFPGCSDGFQALAPRLERYTHHATAGKAQIQAIPLADLIDTARVIVSKDPLALLCDRPYCDRCQATRQIVAA